MLTPSFPFGWSGWAVWESSVFTSFVSTWAGGILWKSLPDSCEESKVLGAERLGGPRATSERAGGLSVPSFRHDAPTLTCASRFPDPRSSVLPAPESELQTSVVV